MLFRVALIALTLAAAPAAMAAPEGVQMAQVQIQPNGMMPIQDRRGGRERDVIPLREVVDMVRGRLGGDLIGARLEQGQRPVYVLRWRMPNNDVRDVRVDAVSGQMR